MAENNDIENTPEPSYDEVVAEQHKEIAETTISPKVIASAATGVALVVIIAVLTAVTPDMLAGLGPWGPLVYAAVVALGSALSGYVARDKLREV